MHIYGNSPVADWLGLGAFTAKGMGSIPGQGTKIPQAGQCSQKQQQQQKMCISKACYQFSFPEEPELLK